MPRLTRHLSPQGAVLDLLVGVSTIKAQQLRLALQAVPHPVVLQAIIDTGASHTSIDARAFQSLGLQPAGYLPISTASASLLIREQFDVHVTIVHPSGHATLNIVLASVRVTDADLLPNQLPALIGCDLLDRWVFRYDGPAREFTLDY